MMALIVSMGDEVFDAYEFRLLANIELFDGEELRRKDVRIVEKDRDWKREVRISADDFMTAEIYGEGFRRLEVFSGVSEFSL